MSKFTKQFNKIIEQIHVSTSLNRKSEPDQPKKPTKAVEKTLTTKKKD